LEDHRWLWPEIQRVSGGAWLLVRILDHSEAVVAVNHFSVGAARAAQRKVLEGIIN
jgi:hypothetical protein